jgi:EAL domain-containing protein (putative c-di-GMP-specific phosphodiesterase class I)
MFEETGVDPTCLQLELTESVLMRDVATSAALLAKFKAMGVQIAVDDFGTGYSSLSYLNQFPIDVLKIDQSFVKAIDAERGWKQRGHRQRRDRHGQESAPACHRRRRRGRGQLAFLKAHRCNEGQGYWFSHPVDAASMQTLFNTGVA